MHITPRSTSAAPENTAAPVTQNRSAHVRAVGPLVAAGALVIGLTCGGLASPALADDAAPGGTVTMSLLSETIHGAIGVPLNVSIAEPRDGAGATYALSPSARNYVPAGITIQPDGTVVGTTTVGGQNFATLLITRSDGNVDVRNLDFDITPGPAVAMSTELQQTGDDDSRGVWDTSSATGETIGAPGRPKVTTGPPTIYGYINPLTTWSNDIDAYGNGVDDDDETFVVTSDNPNDVVTVHGADAEVSFDEPGDRVVTVTSSKGYVTRTVVTVNAPAATPTTAPASSPDPSSSPSVAPTTSSEPGTPATSKSTSKPQPKPTVKPIAHPAASASATVAPSEAPIVTPSASASPSASPSAKAKHHAAKIHHKKKHHKKKHHKKH